MRNFEGLRSYSQLKLRMIGMKRTTTGVLLMKAEAMPTINRVKSMASFALPRETCMTFCATKPTAPVRIMALLMRNMAPTVMTAGFAKPATASVGVRILAKMSAIMIPMAVRSMGILSVINKISAKHRIKETIKMVMVLGQSTLNFIIP